MKHILSCENEFCIYWKKNQCVLDKISLDNQGVCQACIHVTISDDQLDTLRKKLLDTLENSTEI